ncbi:hypothetical protein CLOSTASPAR_05539 [[Clostridium] asparagiforme DSM 15981]|uniref:Uncharacterized protein n=1 Tax=[Clostridium] asparagiforme DSM 15981 TaxID=518636 RepID=C0D8E2_9FIRM|nr:hypothetical protein CLOSTASPAR_05539 [[Clostridium] asparagiforme DSM 15981]
MIGHAREIPSKEENVHVLERESFYRKREIKTDERQGQNLVHLGIL